MTHPWTNRISSAALWLAIIGVAVVVIGLTLGRYEVVEKLTGFYSIPLAALLLALALIVAIVALIMNWRHRSNRRGRAWIALILPIVFFAVIGSIIAGAGDAPPLHDVTTDLADPPAFQTLTLRGDNLVGVGTIENWRDMHAKAYPDIQPVIIDAAPAQVIERAVAVADEMGWDVADADPSEGRMEATAYASYIRFKDDVVVRATPVDGGTRVDVRSVSRVGVGDLGYNAARVREFLERLQAA